MALSANKLKEKEWSGLIRQKVKSFDWKFKSFFAYKANGDFFYHITFFMSGTSDSISGSLSFKPLIIDETFWKITNLTANIKSPLNLRANGAFVVKGKDIFGFYLKIKNNNLENEINSLLEKANLEINNIQSMVNDLDKFSVYVKQHPDKKSERFDIDLLITTTISQGKYSDAISLLKYAKENIKMGGWTFGGKNFYDLAIEYCQKHEGE